jgi:glycosyltransferase involved in cell wall biosynthesis
MQVDLMDKISVIIRNRNESEYIGFAIQSVIDNFNDPEIIIMDNNSTDDSIEIVNLFSLKNNIQIFSINKYSPGKSINDAVKYCSNDIILILSAHSQICKIDHDYIQSCLKHNVAVFGKQTPIYRGKKITPRYIWSHFGNKEVVNLFSDIEDRYFLHNAFCFYNKEHLIKYPFDEKLVGKEDRYWAIDQVKLGYTYLYTPTIEINHYWTKNGATWKGLA